MAACVSAAKTLRSRQLATEAQVVGRIFADYDAHCAAAGAQWRRALGDRRHHLHSHQPYHVEDLHRGTRRRRDESPRRALRGLRVFAQPASNPLTQRTLK